MNANETRTGPQDQQLTIELTVEIISSYVSHNSVPAGDLSGLIRAVHETLTTLAVEPAAPESVEPAVPIKKSVTDDHIICLEDGKKFKSLKRHLRSKYDMSPEEYREKWGLRYDYPMVAPSYARRRSTLAKEMGLGKS